MRLVTHAVRHISTPQACVLTGAEWLIIYLVASLTLVFINREAYNGPSVRLLTDTLRHISTPLASVLTGAEWLTNYLVASLTAIFHQRSNLVSSK
jgi:hypothetical protein